MRAVRDTLTKGILRSTRPPSFAFEVKNGTLRLAPATLSGTGADTKINAYVQLASLKLDSEWVMSLTGKGSKDVPPVTLVFAGPLSAGSRDKSRDRYRGDRGLSHHAAHERGR